MSRDCNGTYQHPQHRPQPRHRPQPPAHRPASTGVYFSLWENKVLELVELLTRSSLEHYKLDLMAEISHLKTRLASAEKDRRELDDRCRVVQRQVVELEAKLLLKDAENSDLRHRLGRNGTLASVDPADTEVDKLKRAVDTLMMANEDKERQLEDMRRLLKRYRRVEELLIQTQAVDELLMTLDDGDISSNSSSTSPSVGDTTFSDQQHHLFPDDKSEGRQGLSSPSAASTPTHYIPNSPFNGGSAGSTIPPSSRQAVGMTRSNSCENMVPGTQVKGSSYRKKGDGSMVEQDMGVNNYGTLPKNRPREDGQERRKMRAFHGLGKTLLRVRSGKRSSSAPNLGDPV